MFEKKITVLFLKKDSLEGASVVLTKTPTIAKLYKSPYLEINLKDVVKNMVSVLKAKSVYLLLSDELAYTLTFVIPLHIQRSEERNYVFNKFSSFVPEDLQDLDWDYKELDVDKDVGKRIVAFAPVNQRFLLLKKYIHELGIKLEAVEPEPISLGRNSNPIIGIALKDDLVGGDSQTLNVGYSISGNFLVNSLRKLFRR